MKNVLVLLFCVCLRLVIDRFGWLSVVSFFVSGVVGLFLVLSVIDMGRIFLWICWLGVMVCMFCMMIVRWCGVV